MFKPEHLNFDDLGERLHAYELKFISSLGAKKLRRDNRRSFFPYH